MTPEPIPAQARTARLRTPPAGFIRRLYAWGMAPLLGRIILLLTTTGRKTSEERVKSRPSVLCRWIG